MRMMLSLAKSFILSPDIIVCRDLDEVYIEIDKNIDDDVLYFFVDSDFVNVDNLSQIELFRFEFNKFQIIIDYGQSVIIDSNPQLNRDLYSISNVTENANEIFISMESYEGDYEIFEQIEEVKSLVNNKSRVQNQIEFDFISFQNNMNGVIKSVETLSESNRDFKNQISELIKERYILKSKIKELQSELNKCNENRGELASENIKMKLNSYIESLNPQEPANITTPVLYIKDVLPQYENDVTKFFHILSTFINNKYNLNVIYIIIDDERRLKSKNLKDDYTYLLSKGKYNMKYLGNRIVTTREYVRGLCENFEKFSGIKDVFIVLDISMSSEIHLSGNGGLIALTNPYLNIDLYKLGDGVEVLEEKLFNKCFEGGDEFNETLKVTRSDIFKKMEELIINIT